MKKYLWFVIGVVVLALAAYGAVMVFGDSGDVAKLPSVEDFATMSDQELLAIRDEVILAYESQVGQVVFEEMPTVVGPPGQDGSIFFTRLLEGAIEPRDTKEARGVVTLFALNPANRFIRLTKFSMTNGPDLRILLTTHPDPMDVIDIGSEFVELGSLKGVAGEQNYIIPSDVDLNKYRTVVIYSAPFRVIFAVSRLDSIEVSEQQSDD